jgi:signal transduction histidine kinase/ActR/RegA family two-component response regulator
MGHSTGHFRLLPATVVVALAAWQAGSSHWPRTWPGPVRIGFAESAPYTERGPGGEYTGATVDVLEEAARRAGIKLTWVDAPGGADKALASGQVDLWPMAAVMEERKKRFHLSEGWIQTYYCLLSRADRTSAGTRIAHAAAVRTRTLAREQLPRAQLVEKPNRDDVITSVCSGEVDAGFVETRVIQATLLNALEPCRGVKLKTKVLYDANFPSAVASTREAAWVADLLRAQIMELSRDGTMVRIFSNWNMATALETNAIFELTDARDRSRRMWLLAAALTCVIGMMGWMILHVRQARQAADRANAAKSEFLANMSHEIRTPLNGVVGLARVLAKSNLNAEDRRMVGDISQCADALMAVINDVLDFSKIEAGKLTMESAPFDLRESLRSAAVPASLAAQVKGLGLELNIDESVPDVVSGDCQCLRQVLLNLLSNAVKFTDSGAVSLRVEPGAGERIRFSVEDSGIGIDAATLERLFRPFTQADSSTSRRYGGTGLGLTISKRLVEMMGGEIEVASKPGLGSRFWFELPLPVSSGTPISTAASPPRDNKRELRILVAEDSVVNQRVVMALLSKMGHTVTLAANGKAAVEAVDSGETPFDLILMDCQMPEMDGYAATREIRQREARERLPPVPIIALTAHAMLSDRDRCLEAGMDGYLTKPIDPERLFAEIGRW